MKQWSVARSDSVFLCDDDNDMELAAEVGRAFLPSISSVRGSRVKGSRGARQVDKGWVPAQI